MEYKHEPVMLKEVIECLSPQPGGKFIDGTLGGGGYTFVLAEKAGKDGLVVSIDADPMAIEHVKLKLKNTKIKTVRLIHGNFSNLEKIITEQFEKKILFDGIVFDLGLSSAQLEDRNRGFSFKFSEAPLRMEFSYSKDLADETDEHGPNAEDIVNGYSEENLIRIFREYGEEKYSRSIARAIVRARPSRRIKTIGHLVELISFAIPGAYRNDRRIHFATRIFQAIRIEANRELEALSSALVQSLELLNSGGRLAVVSYHSLEDRIVKNFFTKESRECLCPPAFPVCRCGHEKSLNILTRKPLTPSNQEKDANSRSRSAKLRVAQKI